MNKKELEQIGRDTLNYYKIQFEKVLLEHDWTYNLTMKIKGTTNETNWIDINKKQFEKIKKNFE